MAKDKNMDKITDHRNPIVISLDARVEHLRDAFGIGTDRGLLRQIIRIGIKAGMKSKPTMRTASCVNNQANTRSCSRDCWMALSTPWMN
jgi:hypothetical protein